MRYTATLAAAAITILCLTACQRASTGAAATVGAGSAAVESQTPTTGGSDWPRFLGPRGDGISPEKGINKNWAAKPPKALWKVDLGDDGYAGPSVANGKVFIIDHSGSKDIVRALDLKTGAEVWKYAYEDASSSNYGFARSTPTVAGGKVYTISRLGNVNCLDEATGKLIWSRNVCNDFGTERPGWDLAGSPVIDGDRVLLAIGGKNAAIVGLHKETGETLFQGGGDTVTGYATPVIATINGVKQYVTFAAKGAMGVDAASGARLWFAPWETSYDVNAATPIVIGNAVFLTSNYGVGCGVFDIGPNGTTQRWKARHITSHFNTPVLWQGMIYGIGDPGFLSCVDPKTGDLKWRQSGFEKGGLMLVDGVLIALDGRTGACVMVKAAPDSYQELGRFTPLGGQSWTAPIVAQGRLIVRNKQAIACFDLK
ncbi:MAG: PQQ-binding-like beta-propeller repeat protein [Chthonomonadales bacterium]|nr:PQQ-binding-like beta-propeller repeat protein [Chthonomonadales bacterium]